MVVDVASSSPNGAYCYREHPRLCLDGIVIIRHYSSLFKSHLTFVRVAAESPITPHMRNSISHPKNDFEGIRSHNPTKLLCLSSKKKCARVKLLH